MKNTAERHPVNKIIRYDIAVVVCVCVRVCVKTDSSNHEGQCPVPRCMIPTQQGKGDSIFWLLQGMEGYVVYTKRQAAGSVSSLD